MTALSRHECRFGVDCGLSHHIQAVVDGGGQIMIGTIPLIPQSASGVGIPRRGVLSMSASMERFRGVVDIFSWLHEGLVFGLVPYVPVQEQQIVTCPPRQLFPH